MTLEFLTISKDNNCKNGGREEIRRCTKQRLSQPVPTLICDTQAHTQRSFCRKERKRPEHFSQCSFSTFWCYFCSIGAKEKALISMFFRLRHQKHARERFLPGFSHKNLGEVSNKKILPVLRLFSEHEQLEKNSRPKDACFKCLGLVFKRRQWHSKNNQGRCSRLNVFQN